MAHLVNKINHRSRENKKKHEIDIGNIGMRRQQIIAKSFGHAGDNLDNDDNAMEVEDDEHFTAEENKDVQKRKRKKNKKSAKRLQSSGKKVEKEFDRATCDIRTLALSLEAVKEDPSLMNVFNDYGHIVDFQYQMKRRGRPKKFKVDEKSLVKKVKKKKKTLKEKKKSRKNLDDQNYDDGENNKDEPKTTTHQGFEEIRKKDKGIGKKSKPPPSPPAESKTKTIIPDDPLEDDFLTF